MHRVCCQLNDYVNSKVFSKNLFAMMDHLRQNDVADILQLELIDFLFHGQGSRVFARNDFDLKHRVLRGVELRIDIDFSRKSLGPRKRGQRDFSRDVVVEFIKLVVWAGFVKFMESKHAGEIDSDALSEILNAFSGITASGE